MSNEIEYIGYAGKSGYNWILILTILSILMNFTFVIYFLIKLHSNKQFRKISSLEQMFVVLSIAETIISSLWLYSEIAFPNNEKLLDDESKDCCLECKILGVIQTFIYLFHWIFLDCTISHLKNMILNPINFILKTGKKIFLYILISCAIASIGAFLSYYLEVVGKSPMITCFLSLDNLNKKNVFFYDKILLIILSLLPCFNLIFYLVQTIIVTKNRSYKNDNENRKIFNDHIFYFILNILMAILIDSLYILYYLNNMEITNKIIRWYFCIATFVICFNSLIVGAVKFIKNGVFKSIKKNCCDKNDDLNERFSINNEENENELMLDAFEISAIKKFVMNVYISVCFCIENSIHSAKSKYTIDPNICNETKEYSITKKEIYSNEDMESLQNDFLVKSREDFIIDCVEYAPKVFKHLREIDNINEKNIVKSLLPMYNKEGISETEGKGGSFFMNSDDFEFCIKTITYNEMELFRKLLLYKMSNYFDENKDSLIVRIYGLYKISMKTGLFKEDEIYFILMKNVIGSFNNNLICKYDLKGSSLDRKVDLGDSTDKVMKDTNFNEIEQVLLLNSILSQKLLENAIRDANFFCDLKIMDYSLLVAKISLNNEEIEELFGKDHRKNQEKYFVEMSGLIMKTRTITAIPDDDDENLKEIKKKKIRFKIERIEPLKKYFYPSLKGDVLYIISIIDFFQLYNLQKNLETKFKLLRARSKKAISSMPPEEYKERFIEFVSSITECEKYLKDLNDPENQNDF